MTRKRLFLAVLICVLPACAQCPDPFAPPSSPVDRLHFPTGLALHPTEPVLFVANSNFDLAFSTGAVLGANLDWLVQRLQRRNDGGFAEEEITERIENPFTAAVLVPSIGGALAVTPDGRHLYHLTRADNRFIEMEVSVDDAQVSLSCGGAADTLPDCTTGDHVLEIPVNDPYGLAVQRIDEDTWQVLVSVLKNGHVFAIDNHVARDGAGRLGIAYDKNVGDADRGGSIAILPGRGGFAPYVFTTGKEIPGETLVLGVARFFNFFAGADAPVHALDLRDHTGAAETRGIAFNRAGDRAYVISRMSPGSGAPAALVEVDVSRGRNGIPLARPMRIVQLGKEPSNIALYEPVNGRPLAITVSFRDNLLVAIDLDTMAVFDVVRSVGSGPFDIVVDSRRALAFVSNFQDDTISVLRLPSGGDQRVRMGARIGIPRDEASDVPDLPDSLSDLQDLVPGVAE